jgi:adenosine/AMP kinase
MSSAANTDPYGLNTATTQVDLRGSYTEVFFALEAGEIFGKDSATHNFTLFLNEGNMLAAGQAIEKLAAIAAGPVATANPTLVTVNVVTDLAASIGSEATEALVIGNTSVATAADFIV